MSIEAITPSIGRLIANELAAPSRPAERGFLPKGQQQKLDGILESIHEADSHSPSEPVVVLREDECPSQELSCVLSPIKPNVEKLSVDVAPNYELKSGICTDEQIYGVSGADCLDSMNMTSRPGEPGLATNRFGLTVINKFVCFYDKCSVPLKEFLSLLPNHLVNTSQEPTRNREVVGPEIVSTPVKPEIKSTPTALSEQERSKKDDPLLKGFGVLVLGTAVGVGAIVLKVLKFVREPHEEPIRRVNVENDEEFEELVRNGELSSEQARLRMAFVECKGSYWTRVVSRFLGLGRGYTSPISRKHAQSLLESDSLPENGRHRKTRNGKKVVFVESDGSGVQRVGRNITRNMRTFVDTLKRHGMQPESVLENLSLARLRRSKENRPAPDNKPVIDIFYEEQNEFEAGECRKKEAYLRELYKNEGLDGRY